MAGPKNKTSKPPFPKRFLPEDIRLHNAVDALDPVAVRQAVIDGARTELRDGQGFTALWRLINKATGDIAEMSEGPGLAFVACLDSLMECGADIESQHHDLLSDHVRECKDREHDCDGCRYAENSDDNCSGLELFQAVEANIEEALDDDHPLAPFCEAFWDWHKRAQDKGLRKAFEEKIAMERLARKPTPGVTKPKRRGP